jgi:hypothetical protein
MGLELLTKASMAAINTDQHHTKQPDPAQIAAYSSIRPDPAMAVSYTTSADVTPAGGRSAAPPWEARADASAQF